MVTIESLTKIGLYSWLLKYSSDLEDPWFYIYLDGILIAETPQNQYNIAINMDEGSVIEVLDDPDALPMQIFPGKVRLGWFFVAGTNYYRIDEYINSAWVQRYRMPENNGYLLWQSRFLEDGQTHIFRVVPVGTNGNEGTARQFAVLMCRRPDVPDVIYTYANADYKVTGELTPDATGDYFVAGTYNSKSFYRRGDNAWFIWWKGSPEVWIISTIMGILGTAYWQSLHNIITGIYDPKMTATGYAYVSVGHNITITQN